MKLIDEWRTAWKFLSVQANVLGGAMASAYATFYPQLKDTISPAAMGCLTGAVFVLQLAVWPETPDLMSFDEEENPQ